MNTPKSWYIVPTIYLLLIWLIYFLQQKYLLLPILGLFPRNNEQLIGILGTVFLHSNAAHILSNTFQLGAGLYLLFYYYPSISLSVTLLAHILTGICVWLFARPAWHIGASGLSMAILFFILISGLLRGNKKLRAIAFALLSMQAGLIFSLMPVQENISWESHLSGAIIGVLLAIIFKNAGPKNDVKTIWGEDNATDEDEYLPFGKNN